MLDDLNNLPIKTVNGATVYMKDVAQVRDGYSVQTNIVRTNGTRGVLMTVTRNGNASTLAIVNAGEGCACRRFSPTLPPELKVAALADQSLFVRASIQGVLREAMIAAGLTGLMILLFLGSWRSTLIVCISIPLSILTSLVHPEPAGTDHQRDDAGRPGAGGRHPGGRRHGRDREHAPQYGDEKPLVRAVLDGAQQIAVPTFVSTLSICIVFVPVLLLTGAARFLFTPLAHGGGFRDARFLSSFAHAGSDHGGIICWSRKWSSIARGRARRRRPRQGRASSGACTICFNALFERLRYRLHRLLDWSLEHRGAVLAAFMGCFARVAGLGAADRRGLLPDRRLRPDAAACARAGRHADRGDRTASSPTSSTRSAA